MSNEKRRRRLLVCLTGFIDESYDASVFVLAGYAAPAEQWALFADAWDAALKAEPAVRPPFKMSNAMALGGAFHGWDDTDRDSKLCKLYDIIDAHVSFEMSAVIPLEPFYRIFRDGRLPRKAGEPYYHALTLLVSGLARHQIQIGMQEKVDFIFDESKVHQDRILAVWGDIARDAPDDVKPMLGGTPVFKTDDELEALQAADFEAWWLRRRWFENLTGAPRLEYPWQPAAIPGVTCVFTEEKMRESHEKILRDHIELGWRPHSERRRRQRDGED